MKTLFLHKNEPSGYFDVKENTSACSCYKHSLYCGFMCYILHVVISHLHPREWMICQTQSFFISNISQTTEGESWEIFGAALPSSGNSQCQSPHTHNTTRQQPVQEPQPTVKLFEHSNKMTCQSVQDFTSTALWFFFFFFFADWQ